MNNISNVDLSVILIYLGGIFFLAYYSSRSKKSTSADEQYLAGKSLTVFESLCSIIATEVSALTFLGIPAIAFSKDYSFIQIYFGALIGRFFIAKIMLPLVYDQGLTIYSVMGKLGTKNAQSAIAIFYAINKFLAVGVRLFSGSILVSEFFSINIYIAVGLICLITFFYTLIGGLKAVVRTDIIQMSIFVFGGLVAHYLIPQVANSEWSFLMSSAYQNGKMLFIDFSNLWPFIIGVLGGILFDMATHGVDQDFAQRLTANKSLKGAQLAIVSSSLLSITVAFIFLSIGSLLWSYYQLNPMPNIPADKIFAHFITTYFPVGIKGLMVAGVLAATMSTLDSSINALSACFYNDIFYKRAKNVSVSKLKSYYLGDTLFITFVFLIIAYIASLSDGLLMFGLKITSWTAGTLLSIFFSTLVFKICRPSVYNIIGAYVLGALGVALNTFYLEWNWNFNVYFGFGLSTVFLYCWDRYSIRT